MRCMNETAATTETIDRTLTDRRQPTRMVAAVEPADVPSEQVETLLDDELLVEEISIDGMCGVY